MKIKESELRNIISESIARILNETEINKKNKIENPTSDEKEIMQVVRKTLAGLERFGRTGKKDKYDQKTVEIFGGLDDMPFYKDEYGTFDVDITGGWNGNGDWGTYFGALEEFIRKLAREKIRAWLINMDNDCCDDVFTASFGLRKEKEENVIKESFEIPYSDVAEKVWGGEYETVDRPSVIPEDWEHVGNAVDPNGEICGRLFKGKETGKIYFFDM